MHHKQVYSIKNPKEQNEPTVSVQTMDDTSGATSLSPSHGGPSSVLTSKKRRLKSNSTYLSNAINHSMSMILGTEGSNTVPDAASGKDASLRRPIRCCRFSSSLGKSDTLGLETLPESLAAEKVWFIKP